MDMIWRMGVDQSPGGEPERRGDERSEAPRSGGSPPGDREVAPVTPPDPEVVAPRPPTIHDRLQARDPAESGRVCASRRARGLVATRRALLVALVTWRRQREHGLAPTWRKPTSGDPRVKKLEREKAALATDKRRLERRLQRAETIITFQKKVAELLGMKPLRRRDRVMRPAAASPTMGTAAACDALGVPRASVYRRRQPARPSCAAGAAARAGFP